MRSRRTSRSDCFIIKGGIVDENPFVITDEYVTEKVPKLTLIEEDDDVNIEDI